MRTPIRARRNTRPLTSACLIVALLLAASCSARAEWEALGVGIDLGHFAVSHADSLKAEVLVLRADPQEWELRVHCASESDRSSMTAREWCERSGLVAATNAGMFDVDFNTHVGFLAVGDHVNSAAVNHYKSVAVFGPKRAGLPRFRIVDVEEPKQQVTALCDDYENVVQNLRLIRRPGENRWQQQRRTWSEAALGEDDEGRILFIFSRTPLTMHDFNEALLGLEIGLVAAQHLEGGHEAQLFVALTELEIGGSVATGFDTKRGARASLPIPNVIGLARRSKP
ncbi:MAG: phosphodiester glycosidase family protein [Candidatus Latescibacterota bacterium]|nr:MAG: phosphodiester glycosidase family protein [Candidatus Latescibacterota bacterium]